MSSVRPSALTIALSHARGSYQRDVVTGAARWSGADLRGKASRYSGRYAESRRNLLGRLEADERLAVRIDRGKRGLLTLVIELADDAAFDAAFDAAAERASEAA